MMDNRFASRKCYTVMIDDHSRIAWRHLFYRNYARPRASHTTWLACHGRLATKDRLCRFGLIQEKICSLCNEVDESHDHLFFACSESKKVWSEVLNWIDCQHSPQPWNEEIV